VPAVTFNDPKKVLNDIARANFHRGGLKTARLFRLEPDFFRRVREEVLRFVDLHRPSDVQGTGHVTNWTKPFGSVFQFSLLNRSGRVDDTSSDHDLSLDGKRFHFGSEFPALAAFVTAFPHAINMRLNAMGEKGGLSPHEEHPLRYRTDRDCWLTARFHLPVVTNPAVEVLLDGELFRLEEGSVFFFNNGCIHSAVNRGENVRYHLVWDMLLTRETYELMFAESGGDLPPFLHRTVGAERVPAAHHREPIREYQTYGPGLDLYKKWDLGRFRIPPYRFQNLYTSWRYLRHQWRESVDFYQA
jgi:hypothetical protein